MAIEETNIEQTKTHWFIDLDWYQLNGRSFFILAQRCFCPKCRKRLDIEETELTADKLLNVIKDCCSQERDFITIRLPILESVFRLFLANGNHPLELKGLVRQLSERRGEEFYPISEDVLSRLLKNDQYYGIRQVVV